MKTSKRSKPCGNCRQRKRRCMVEPGQTVCVLCQLYGIDGCSFEGKLPERPLKRAKASGEGSSSRVARTDDPPIRTVDVIEDYDALQGPSLLKKNLGLQQFQFSRYNGPSSSWAPFLLDYCEFNDRDEHPLPSRSSIRRVSADTSFLLKKYSGTQMRADEIDLLDQIERVVAPHGPNLVSLYFRIVHPSFPMLDKKVFLEKYERTHREFSPSCLGGVYLLALDWWNYDPVLSAQERPDANILEAYVRRGLNDVMPRPKLSTLQGGLLLLQHRPFGDDAWALSAQLVATMQELGVHLDCDGWRLPAWEKSLRKRLAWSIYILDKWMALIHGRPSHIVDELDWVVEPLVEEDFPETPADEDQEEGSGEIAAGRLTFQNFASLSQIVDEILRAFYSARATKTTRSYKTLLQVAKPIQIRLREWRRQLPDSLQPESTKARKQSAAGSLHLAYYAVEISLHRAIIHGLKGSTCDPSIISVCREAARERAIMSIDFVRSLRPEHIQAFWLFPSGMNFVYIGIFTALLYLTSRTVEEARFYHSYLSDYRWTLRVMSRTASFLEFAVQRLDMSLLHLDPLSPQDIVQNMHMQNPQSGNSNDGAIHGERGDQTKDMPPGYPSLPGTDASTVASDPQRQQGHVPLPAPTAIFDQQRFLAILDAAEMDALLPDQISPEAIALGDSLDFYGRNWNNPGETEMFSALDLSPS
ncbi:hypothetical protein MAP00_008525 [Monascus purpureus]|nr:hypothetical protein MAP00_008525 [Monascus purpureus]